MESQLRNVFQTGVTRPVGHRENALRRLKKNIKLLEPKIIAALKKDLGKSEWETRSTETGFVIAEINHTLEFLSEWARVQEFPAPLASQPASTRVVPTPKGAVLIIAPWNYPFQLAIAPLVAAIAAGNTVAVKPSELTPSISAVIHELIKTTFTDGTVECVEGGVDVSEQLLKEPFAHFFFTGSTRVGKIVAHAAADHLASSTLELGGKSPCVIDSTANLKQTSRRIAWGKALNAGQTCVAPDYLIIHEDIHDCLVDAIKREWAKFYGTDPSQSPDYGRIVSLQHFDRLNGLLKTSQGKVHGGRHDRSTRYIEPTLVTDIDDKHPVMREEIFGPILPVLKWRTEADLDQILRQHLNPLAFYVFTTKSSFADSLMEKHAFGGGCVNHIAHHLGCQDLPFGGIRTSGVGQYHGKYGFDAFTHYKGILSASPRFDFTLKYPPYKNRAPWLKWLHR